MSNTLARVLVAGLLVVAIGCGTKVAPEAAPPAEKATPAATTADAPTGADVEKKIDEAAATSADYLAAQKQKAIDRFEAHKSQFDAQIKSLETQAQLAKDNAKTQLDKAIADLKTQRAKAESQIAQIKSSTAESWKDLQGKFDSASQEMKESMNSILSSFTGDSTTAPANPPATK